MSEEEDQRVTAFRYWTETDDETSSEDSDTTGSYTNEAEEDEENDGNFEEHEEVHTEDEETESEEDDDSFYDYIYDYDNYSETDDSEAEDKESGNSKSDEGLEAENESVTEDELDNDSFSSSDDEEEEEDPPVRPRKLPDGKTLSSQCHFQSEPKLPSEGSAAQLASYVDPYLDSAPSLSSEELQSYMWYYAEYFGIVSGNWLAFVSSNDAASLWQDTKEANEDGELGGYVEMRKRGAEYVIAAHVRDYRDIDDAVRVLNNLNEVCAQHGVGVACFKATAVTTLGIYRTRDNGTRYTYDDVGFRHMPTPDGIAEVLAARRGRAGGGTRRYVAKRQRRRGRKRRGRGGKKWRPHYATDDYRWSDVNPYYHGQRSNPSMPNGTWSGYEVSAGFIFHAGRPAQVRSRSGVYRSYVESEVVRRLEAHRLRLEAGEYVSSAERRALMESLWDIADQYNFTAGKWKVFAPARVADGIWRDLCIANDRGVLGGNLKISPFNERTGTFMICVYCNDFADVADCSRILAEVQSIIQPYGVNVIGNFKPDFLSSVRVYRSNLRGTRFNYALNELGLVKHWPNRALKRVLDAYKGK